MPTEVLELLPRTLFVWDNVTAAGEVVVVLVDEVDARGVLGANLVVLRHASDLNTGSATFELVETAPSGDEPQLLFVAPTTAASATVDDGSERDAIVSVVVPTTGRPATASYQLRGRFRQGEFADLNQADCTVLLWLLTAEESDCERARPSPDPSTPEHGCRCVRLAGGD